MRTAAAQVRSWAAAQSRSSAPWLYPDTPELRRSRAWLLVLGIYLAGWADGLAGATWYLATDDRLPAPGWHLATSNTLLELSSAGLLVALVLAVCHHLTGTWALRRNWKSWPALVDEAAVAGAGLYASFAGFGAVAGLSAVTSWPAQYPSTADQTLPGALSDAVSALLAGPTEEVFFCVLVLTVLRRARYSMPAAVAVSAGLRVLFHAYYGPPAAGLLLWAATAAAIYALTGRVLGLMVAHSAWDLNVTGTLNHWPGLRLAALLVIIVCLLALGYEAYRAHQARRDPTSPP